MSKMISYIVINDTLCPTRKAYKKARFKKILNRALNHKLGLKRNKNE